MLHPAEPSELIPDEQVTVAVVAVTELLLAAVTVGLVVQDAALTVPLTATVLGLTLLIVLHPAIAMDTLPL